MVRRVFDLLDHIKRNFPDKHDVFGAKIDGKWISYSTQNYLEYANNISIGLLAMGFKAGDKIAIVSNNRPDWNFFDMGMSQIGVVHVPIYPTISIDDFTYILHHSEPKMVLVSDKSTYEKLKPLVNRIATIKWMYSFNSIPGVPNWTEIVDLGSDNFDKYLDELEERKAIIEPDSLSTLIYTSGTTGVPKGVMLSHRNLVSNFVAHSTHHQLDHRHKALSVLPLSHIYERSVNYHFQYKGLSIYYAENMGTIMENIREIKPHITLCVPRLLERIYDGIMNKGRDLSSIKKEIFFWAVRLGLKYNRNNENGWFYRQKLKIADKLVYSKWREALGGNLGIVVSGGAALQSRISCLFGAAGIEILEGYGLTETSPVIAVSNLTTNEIMYGTVGIILKGVEVKIAEDGEILCKGPNVMLGYYKEPDLTSEAIDKDGWFHTGDIGVLIDEKFLKITDRKKEMFKLSSGKYIAPQVIENKFKESPLIEQLMVIGENEKFASALISPNFPYLHNWCSLHHVRFRDNEDLIKLPEVQEKYQKVVSSINAKLGQTEHIKRFRLVAEEWTPATGELSPTLKLRRKFIFDKYRDIIEDIFSKSNGDNGNEKQ